MKNKERKLVYWNLIIAISITLLLIWFSLTGVFKEIEFKRGITGLAVSGVADAENNLNSDKIKAMYVYGSDYTPENINKILENGLNTIVFSMGDLSPNKNPNCIVPDSIKNSAITAKQNNLMFFPKIYFSNKEFRFEHTVLKDGSEINHTSPWSEDYWNNLTEITKNLAVLSLDNEYKINGVWFDFELYNLGGGGYFNDSWGFEDSVFNKYLVNRSLKNWNNPPNESNYENRSQRYNWLSNNGKLNDYSLFLHQEIYRLANKYKNEVKAINHNFLIGAYPSPRPYFMYLNDIFSGWSSVNEPAVVWGTETYNGGTKNLPAGIENRKINNYYNLTDYYGKEIYAYYVSGFLARIYKGGDIYGNYSDALKKTNGYWIFSSYNFFKTCEVIQNLYYYRLPVNCENDSRNSGCCNKQWELSNETWMTECCPYYEKAKTDYWNAIKLANYKLDCQETNNGIEICDDIDNDCDSLIDESLDCEIIEQTCEQAGFICVSGTCNGTIMNYNCTDASKICCNQTSVTERSCTQRGFYCLAPSNCSSSDILNYECSSGVCCSKLPPEFNSTINLTQQDKTCAEQGGRICNSTQYCNGSIGWASDGNCCLGECKEEGTNGTEKPEHNYWFYWFLGGLLVAIIGVASYIIYEVNKKRNFALMLSIIVIFLVLIGSFFFVFNDFRKEKIGITGYAISSQADEDFIFTFSPMEIRNNGDAYREARIAEIKDMMTTGMTHMNIKVWPEYPSDSVIDSYLQELTSYNLIQDISAGHETDNGTPKGLLELVNADADGGRQFLNTSCIEANKNICENWNKSQLISPAYTGTLWENTINNTKKVSGRLDADIVFFDTEIWTKPENLKWFYEYGDPGKNCSCTNVVEEAIGIQKYYTDWKQRGLDLKNAVRQVNPSAEVYFYHEIPEGEIRYTPLPNGSYTGRDIGYMPAGTGDGPATSLYVLPNLEVLEMNMDSMDLSEALVFISPTYLYGYSDYFRYSYTYTGEWLDDIFFDPSVSREAGRMLRKEGLRGFYVYPNIYVDQLFHGSHVHDYWLNHTKELIAGFLEENYIETNKIKNPDFEAFKTKGAGEKGYNETLYFTSGYIGSTLIEPVQFSPVFWTWTDSNSSYKDSAEYSTLSRDKQSGTYAWGHTRNGDTGNRTISSSNFSIESGEQGNYTFSIWAKTNINSNSKIKFYLVNNNVEEKIGETSFQASWNEFKGNIEIEQGDYELKIFIEDNTGQKADIFLDNVSLMQGSIVIECGDGSCNGNENCSSCPQDCDICPVEQNETCQERGYFCLPSVNCSSTDRLPYNCNSEICCSKLPTIINDTIIIQQDKTCAEQSGKICNSTQYCTGAIGWASDGNCCLGVCVEGSGIAECEAKGSTCRETCLTNETRLEYYCDTGVCCGEEEKPESYWMYGIIGLLIVGIVGAGFMIASKLRKGREQGKVNEEIRQIILVKEDPIVSENETQNQEKMKEAEELVLQARSKGYNEEDIRNLFLNKGWNEKLVEKMIKEVEREK